MFHRLVRVHTNAKNLSYFVNSYPTLPNVLKSSIVLQHPNLFTFLNKQSISYFTKTPLIKRGFSTMSEKPPVSVKEPVVKLEKSQLSVEERLIKLENTVYVEKCSDQIGENKPLKHNISTLQFSVVMLAISICINSFTFFQIMP